MMAKRALFIFYFFDIVDLGRDVYERQLLLDPPKNLRIRFWLDLLRPVSSLERSSQSEKVKGKKIKKRGIKRRRTDLECSRRTARGGTGDRSSLLP